MASKKENKTPKNAEVASDKEEKKLMEEHPFETMSQIQNRYGKGRKKNGSEETPLQDGRGSNH
jgi:hypothetical protein